MEKVTITKSPLVNGYMTNRVNEAGEAVETLYFVDIEKDQVYETKEAPYAAYFTTREWKASDKSSKWVFTETEFIGRYAQPTL